MKYQKNKLFKSTNQQQQKQHYPSVLKDPMNTGVATSILIPKKRQLHVIRSGRQGNSKNNQLMHKSREQKVKDRFTYLT